jgi:hypothetical protein
MFQTTNQLLFFFLKLFDHIWGEVISYLIAVDLHSDSISLDHYGLPPAELRFESMVCPNVMKQAQSHRPFSLTLLSRLARQRG